MYQVYSYESWDPEGKGTDKFSTFEEAQEEFDTLLNLLKEQDVGFYYSIVGPNGTVIQEVTG